MKNLRKKSTVVFSIVTILLCITANALLYPETSTMIDNVKLIGDDDSVTIYEDAEDGSTHRWVIDGNGIPGAEVQNIYDAETYSRVIELREFGTNSSFRLGTGIGTSMSTTAFNNTTQFILEWSMNFNVDFEILVVVYTLSGYKAIYYTPIDYDRGFLNWGSGYVHIGLGSYVIGNGWMTFTRDLRTDLNTYLPGETITKVMFFKVRGIGDYIPPEPPTANAHTIGFWKNNIRKALKNAANGFQIDRQTLEGYLVTVSLFYKSPFADIDLQTAYDILQARGSDEIILLKKQLLAAELSYINGAILLGDTSLTIGLLEEGEDMILNPGTRDEVITLKNKLDAYNNNEIVE